MEPPERLALFKEHLASPAGRIKLDDLTAETVRDVLRQTAPGSPPWGEPVTTGEHVAARLKAYEDAVRPLLEGGVMLGKWAGVENLPTLSKAVARMADSSSVPPEQGTMPKAFRWYPVSLVCYAAGIAALSAGNYRAFAAVHSARGVARTRRGEAAVPILVPVVEAMLELAQGNVWRSLPGYERRQTPESDYLAAVLEPVLDELLFLGTDMDGLFDRYELLRALMYADATEGDWTPIGRFGRLHANAWGSGGPYTALHTEADAEKDRWGPITAGLFGGEYSRFKEVATKFEEKTLKGCLETVGPVVYRRRSWHGSRTRPT